MFSCRADVVLFLLFTSLGSSWKVANKLVSHQKHDAISSTVAFGKLGFLLSRGCIHPNTDLPVKLTEEQNFHCFKQI